jgi:hypothetical protein
MIKWKCKYTATVNQWLDVYHYFQIIIQLSDLSIDEIKWRLNLILDNQENLNDLLA